MLVFKATDAFKTLLNELLEGKGEEQIDKYIEFGRSV
jgi:hypothetical protein